MKASRSGIRFVSEERLRIDLRPDREWHLRLADTAPPMEQWTPAQRAEAERESRGTPVDHDRAVVESVIDDLLASRPELADQRVALETELLGRGTTNRDPQ